MNEQELDRLMRQIAEDAALDDSTTNEIADSPALWWNVQREVRNAAPEKAPWPPNYLRKWFMIAAPVAAVVVIALGFYVNSLRSPSNDVASDSGSGSTPSTALSSIQPAEPSNAPVTAAVNTVATTQHEPTPARIAKRDTKKSRVSVSPTLVARKATKTATEIRSEFIALAYARNADSGQLIRVKVPSSMMVTLGVVPTVAKPSDLVDAEVIVGDDGLTRAIRFIRQ